MPNFSNWGNPPIDYSEPGVNILSLAPGGGTAIMSGTSMAAPHLAGILLAAPYGVTGDGFVTGDPDGYSDQIGVGKISNLSVYISGVGLVKGEREETYTANASGGNSPYLINGI